MNFRIFSPVVQNLFFLGITATSTFLSCAEAVGQSATGYLTDPATGIVYRKVTTTVESPVVETKIDRSEQTVYRPQTITETKPHTRTIYIPVVEYKLKPRLHGRWNPFRQPSLGYEHVPHTSWEAREEVVHRTNTRTQWVAERQTVDVPTRIVRMQREQKIEYEPIGRILPDGPSEATAGTYSGGGDAFAARLQPVDASARIEAIGGPNGYEPPRLASSTVAGPNTSSTRSPAQQGMQPTDLAPTMPAGLNNLPGNGTGIATGRMLPIYR